MVRTGCFAALRMTVYKDARGVKCYAPAVRDTRSALELFRRGTADKISRVLFRPERIQRVPIDPGLFQRDGLTPQIRGEFFHRHAWYALCYVLVVDDHSHQGGFHGEREHRRGAEYVQGGGR